MCCCRTWYSDLEEAVRFGLYRLLLQSLTLVVVWGLGVLVFWVGGLYVGLGFWCVELGMVILFSGTFLASWGGLDGGQRLSFP